MHDLVRREIVPRRFRSLIRIRDPREAPEEMARQNRPTYNFALLIPTRCLWFTGIATPKKRCPISTGKAEPED